ncbi:hypothetical protein [Methanofollis fontis]|uniref:Uncharacterized protein n=2 Tax=Methanofollis fontis TaxID=2052832 RepID=A0A483CW09_9EURY|nr:hypothetical protein CUJ86_03165 [Methanofollis fontis]
MTIIENLKDNLRSDEKVYLVADSAFNAAKNLQSMGQRLFWISRVPATITETRTLIRSECSFSPCADERYGYSEHFSEYAGIRQKWDPLPLRRDAYAAGKTFEKNLAKAKTSLRKLGTREFVCEPDARIAAEKWLDDHPSYWFSSLDITLASHLISTGLSGTLLNFHLS